MRLIVPYPPGGAVDAVARISGVKLSEQLNQNFIIDNRAGANGVIGGELVARAQADGYTLLSTASIHVINALVVAKVPYDPVKDFTPVSQVAAGPLLVVAHPALPANGIRELIAYAKANPGKLTCAISSRGAAGHLATEMLKFGAGLDFLIVPYKGSGPAYIDLIGGRVQFMMDPILAALPHVQERPAEGAGGDQSQANVHGAGGSDGRGIRRGGLRLLLVVRPVGPARHAARRGGAARARGEPHGEAARRRSAPHGAGLRDGRLVTGGIRALHRGRDGEVHEDRAAGGDYRGVKASWAMGEGSDVPSHWSRVTRSPITNHAFY